MTISKVSEILAQLHDELSKARDGELMMASECLTSYVQDHNDQAAWRENERAINRLAKAWDKMIAKLEKWQAEVSAIEASADNFYGD